MNRIHIISGIAIAMITLLLVTTTTMSGQQSAFAHRSHNHGGGATPPAQHLKVLQRCAAAGGAQPQHAASEGYQHSHIHQLKMFVNRTGGWSTKRQ